MKITLNLTNKQIKILSKTLHDCCKEMKRHNEEEEKINRLSDFEKDYYENLIDISNKFVLSIQSQGGL